MILSATQQFAGQRVGGRHVEPEEAGQEAEVPGLAELIAGTTALDRLGGPGDVADVVAFLGDSCLCG